MFSFVGMLAARQYNFGLKIGNTISKSCLCHLFFCGNVAGKQEVRAPAIVSLSLGISSGPHPRNWTHVIDHGDDEDDYEDTGSDEDDNPLINM